MKKIASIFTVLAIFLILGSPANALISKTIYRTSGVSAFSQWSTEVGGVYTDTFLGVTESQIGTDIYFDTCTYTIEPEWWSCKSGYFFTDDDVFNTDRKLNTANLSPVVMELWDWDNGTVENIILQAQWSGTGDLEKGNFRVMSKYGNFMGKYNEQSRFREATATASLNGNDLGISMYGDLIQFKSAEMIMEK